MLNTIDEVQSFCKSIKVKPSKVYISKDQDGGSYIIVNFSSEKHSQRYKREVTKLLNKLDYQQDSSLENEQELQKVFEEMNATRH